MLGGGSVRARNQKLLNFKNPEKVVSIDLKLSQTFFNNIRKRKIFEVNYIFLSPSACMTHLSPKSRKCVFTISNLITTDRPIDEPSLLKNRYFTTKNK